MQAGMIAMNPIYLGFITRLDDFPLNAYRVIPTIKRWQQSYNKYNAFSLGYLDTSLITKIVVKGSTAIIVSVSDPMTKDAA